MIRFRDSVTPMKTVIRGIHGFLPEKLEAAYKAGLLPVQIRILRWTGAACLAAALTGFCVSPDVKGLLWFTAASAVVLRICLKPASTPFKAGQHYLFIILASALSVLILPLSAWQSGWVLLYIIVLTACAVIGCRVHEPVAVVSGILVYLAYTLMAGIRESYSPFGPAWDSLILILILTLSILTGALIGSRHRKRFAADDELNRLRQRLNDFRENQHDELVRAKNSLALEIRAHTEAEKRLRDSEEKYRNLVEALPQGIFIEQEGRVVLFNPGLEQLTGITPDRLSGMPAASLFAGGAKEIGGHGHARITRPDKSRLYIEKQWVEIRFNRRPAKLYTVTDITERVNTRLEKERLESELEKAKKMEALGLLAGGVAHDLNNILSGIVSTPELLLMDLPADSPMKAPIETIKDSGKRAAVIVDELLTLGKGTAKVIEPVNVNEVIEDYLVSPEFLKCSDFHPGVRVKTFLDAGLPLLNASGLHLRKVVMNLVTNAMEAIGSKGEIRITTTCKDHSNSRLKGYKKRLNGKYVGVRISDTGPGIAPEDLDRIFEPFYTKKILGRSGTGLGLSIVWNIVHDHRGCIRVGSKDSGTVFDLYFPVATILRDTDKPAKIYTLHDYKGMGQSVLVVDDDASQQKISANMLKRLEYKVSVLESGEAAIEYLKTNRADLVILDMIMAPGMDGLSAFKALRSVDPGIRAVIASGYSKTGDVLKAQALGAGPFIKKPFSLQTLGLAVKEELERLDHDNH